jgi:exodeoxyribonuclease III
VRIATWNVNGIRARLPQVVECVDREAPDVMCLQEIKATEDQIGETLTLLPAYWNYWHGGPKGYSGVSLHVKKERAAARPAFDHPPFDFENRVVTVTLDDVTVASLYVPNGGKDYAAKLQFLDALCGWAAQVQTQGRRLVLCGDLNVARADVDVHPKERKAGAIGQRPEERARFERLLATGLYDVARRIDPSNDALYTWWPPWRGLRQKNQGWRIDYVLASASLEAKEFRVLADFGSSDHAPVVASF